MAHDDVSRATPTHCSRHEWNEERERRGDAGSDSVRETTRCVVFLFLSLSPPTLRLSPSSQRETEEEVHIPSSTSSSAAFPDLGHGGSRLRKVVHVSLSLASSCSSHILGLPGGFSLLEVPRIPQLLYFELLMSEIPALSLRASVRVRETLFGLIHLRSRPREFMTSTVRCPYH